MNSKNISFDTREKLLLSINYLIDSAYIIIHVYEYECIQKLIDVGDEDKLYNLTNVFRFREDLYAVNDFKVFENILTDSYPDEMKMSKTSVWKLTLQP